MMARAVFLFFLHEGGGLKKNLNASTYYCSYHMQYERRATTDWGMLRRSRCVQIFLKTFVVKYRYIDRPGGSVGDLETF